MKFRKKIRDPIHFDQRHLKHSWPSEVALLKDGPEKGEWEI